MEVGAYDPGMATINASILGGDWRDLLERLRKGEPLTLTQNGEPVVTLTTVDGRNGVRTADPAQVEAAMRLVSGITPNHTVTTDEVIAWRHEGHRF